MRRRLLTSMVLVTLLAVVLFGVPLGLAAARLFRGREVSRLEREATRAAGAVPESGLGGGDPIALPTPARRVQLALYDAGGRRVAGVGPQAAGTEVQGALAGRASDDHDGGWLAVAVPVNDETEIVGAARAAIPWDAVAEDTHTSWLVMAGFGAAAAALAAAVGWSQASRLVAPVEAVAELAVRLGDGDFAGRLAPSGVPELDRASVALNRTAGRLGDLVDRERAFTTDVSHQLNTPLTSLRLGLESALLTPDDDHEAALAQAIVEVERLETTVATLLAVARDGQVMRDAPCAVEPVCVEVADRFRAALAGAGRPLRTDLEAALPPARCPPDVLREILAVLVDNARQHGTGAVTVAARRAGAGVVVDVADEGPGIPGEAGALFRRRSPDAAGHGIGLALARSLAEAHGARLELTRAAPHPVFSVALAGVRRSTAQI